MHDLDERSPRRDAGVPADHRATFERDGYVILGGALDAPTLERLRKAVDRTYLEERGEDVGPLHLLAFCGRDAAFLELLDHPTTLSFVVGVLGSNVFMHHCHLDVHPPETDPRRTWMWHQDGGIVNRDLESDPRPRLSVKVAYFLTDVSEPGRGNFMVLPGSHVRNTIDRPADDDNAIEGATPVLAAAGDAVVFDRRLWHMRSPNRSAVTRKALFYAYTYRWIRPRDALEVRAELSHLIDPVRAQLLGGAAHTSDYWMPDHVDVPVRDATGVWTDGASR
jgi:ectoine hydroxylase